jgi:hypothetical protein
MPGAPPGRGGGPLRAGAGMVGCGDDGIGIGGATGAANEGAGGDAMPPPGLGGGGPLRTGGIGRGTDGAGTPPPGLSMLPGAAPGEPAPPPGRPGGGLRPAGDIGPTDGDVGSCAGIPAGGVGRGGGDCGPLDPGGGSRRGGGGLAAWWEVWRWDGVG